MFYYGPFSYNVHSNDLILLIGIRCDIFSYTDINTACCYGKVIQTVKHYLENVGLRYIKLINITSK